MKSFVLFLDVLSTHPRSLSVFAAYSPNERGRAVDAQHVAKDTGVDSDGEPAGRGRFRGKDILRKKSS